MFLLKLKLKTLSPTIAMAGITVKAAEKYAVVTGANKGIGLEICRQLASQGISVVLTARNERRGLEAVDKLKTSGISDYVTFHQLDVTDQSSVESLAGFLRSKIGKLDILFDVSLSSSIKNELHTYNGKGITVQVNNAGINGVTDSETGGSKSQKTEHDLAAECLEINYYGLTRTTEMLLPLLQLSDSPRIVNISSTMKSVGSNKRARDTLNDIGSLTEEKIDQVLKEYLKDFKQRSIAAKGWPTYWSVYCVSKAAVTAYTRLLAKKYPKILSNSVCPGWVKTDLSSHSGPLSPEQGAKSPVRLALLPDGGPSGLFFDQMQVSS